jgi:hypothetical protein
MSRYPESRLKFIQGDSREKVCTLEGDSIGHCDTKLDMNTCLILIGYRDTAVGIGAHQLCEYSVCVAA